MISLDLFMGLNGSVVKFLAKIEILLKFTQTLQYILFLFFFPEELAQGISIPVISKEKKNKIYTTLFDVKNVSLKSKTLWNMYQVLKLATVLTGWNKAADL